MTERDEPEAVEADLDDFDLPISVRAVDPDTGGPGRYLAFNTAFFDVNELSEEPSSPSDVVGDESTQIDAADQRVIDHGRSTEVHVGRAGELLSLRKMPVVRDGSVVAILTVSTDVTAMATAETERDMLAVAAHATDDRLYLYRIEDGRAELVFANRAGNAFLERIAGASDPLTARARRRLDESLAEVVGGGERQESTIELDDEISLVRDEPLGLPFGGVSGVVRTISDLTPALRADWTGQLLEMATLHDTAEAIDRAFTIGCELLDLPIAVLAELVDDELVIHGQRTAERLPRSLPAHADFVAVTRSGRVQIARDLTRADDTGPIINRLGLKTVASIPIEVDDEPWGLLAFGGSEPRRTRFPERTIPLLAALGGTLSNMLERDAARDRLVPVELLQRSNRELEEYAYAAAHDLRSPLRGMSSFAQLLKAQVRTDPDDRERLDRYADRIIAGAERMEALLSSMLDHARVTSGESGPVRDATPLGDLVDAVTASLDEALRASEARVIAGDLPAVTLDSGQMERIVHNLIDNAIKYRHPDRAPEVRIDSVMDAESDELVLTVTDNGPGIPPESRDLVFGLFKRLTTDGDGTGVGLAMVRRIVEEHGGRVGVDDGPEGGARFVIRLPARYVAPSTPTPSTGS